MQFTSVSLGLRLAFAAPQLLAPQRAQARLTLRVRRRCLLSGLAAGDRHPLRPFRCKRGIRSDSVRSRRTLAHDLDLCGQEARGAAEHLPSDIWI